MIRFFDLSTHKLAYQLHENPGTARILFLHGCGTSHSQFEREFNRLSDRYSVAAISLRGQGESSRPAGGNSDDMRMSALAADLIQWLRAHDWNQCTVIACSMGGVVAFEAMRQCSDLFSGIVTFGTTPRLKLPTGAVKAGAWLADVFLPGLFPNLIARAMVKSTTDQPEAQERFFIDLKKAYTQSRTIYQLRCALADYDYSPLLKGIRVPVLLLQGEKDHSVNKEIEKLWPEIGKNQFVTRQFLPDAGHLANYDQPDAFYEAICQFLEEQEL